MKNSLLLNQHNGDDAPQNPFIRVWYIFDHLKDFSLKTFTEKANRDIFMIISSYTRSKGVTYLRLSEKENESEKLV